MKCPDVCYEEKHRIGSPPLRGRGFQSRSEVQTATIFAVAIFVAVAVALEIPIGKFSTGNSHRTGKNRELRQVFSRGRGLPVNRCRKILYYGEFPQEKNRETRRGFSRGRRGLIGNPYYRKIPYHIFHFWIAYFP